MDRANPFDAVEAFERQIAEFTGAPYAVAVDTCTAALFLALKQFHMTGVSARLMDSLAQQVMPPIPLLEIPKRTFVSVPQAAIQAGFKIRWTDKDWQQRGYYRLDPSPVFDSAICLRKDLFVEDMRVSQYEKALCLSFQYRKPLPIGRGGMILHNWGEEADKWFRLARFFGRHPVPALEDPGPEFIGWHMYMEPERASKGLTHFMHYPEAGIHQRIQYPDLSRYKVFARHTVSEDLD